MLFLPAGLSNEKAQAGCTEARKEKGCLCENRREMHTHILSLYRTQRSPGCTRGQAGEKGEK